VEGVSGKVIGCEHGQSCCVLAAIESARDAAAPGSEQRAG
jgi:hypothetical protein